MRARLLNVTVVFDAGILKRVRGFRTDVVDDKFGLRFVVYVCGAGSIAQRQVLIMSQVDYQIWRTFAVPMAILSAILLAMVIVPGVGIYIDGSRRWLRLGPINVQPTELAKLSTVVLLAWWMARVQRHAKEFKKGILVPLAFLMVFTSLIIVEPDFGATEAPDVKLLMDQLIPWIEERV